MESENKPNEQGLNGTQLEQIKNMFQDGIKSFKESEVNEKVASNSIEKIPADRTVLQELADEKVAKEKAEQVDTLADQRAEKRNELLRLGKELGGASLETVMKYQNNYFGKGFKTDAIIADCSADLLEMIVGDESYNKYIPNYKNAEVSSFLEETDATKRLNKAEKLFEVVYGVLDNKRIVEVEQANKKANSSQFGGGENLTIFDMQKKAMNGKLGNL